MNSEDGSTWVERVILVLCMDFSPGRHSVQRTYLIVGRPSLSCYSIFYHIVDRVRTLSPTVAPRSPSTKSRRHRVRNNKLIIRLEALAHASRNHQPSSTPFPTPIPLPPSSTVKKKKEKKNYTHREQIAHALIQRRRKDRIHVEKHRLRIRAAQLIPQELDHRFEALSCADLVDLFQQDGRPTHGFEPDRDCAMGMSATMGGPCFS